MLKAVADATAFCVGILDVMSVNDLLAELRQLNLPEGEYVVFGSGPMEIHGIRKAGDLDLLITGTLWDVLVAQGHQPKVDDWEFDDADGIHRQIHTEQIKIGNIEMYREWGYIKETPAEVIADADIYEGIRFGKLAYVLESKRNFNRPKDKIDVKLIEDYLSN